MIEFDGYISGNAEKHFWKKSAQFGQKVILFSMILCFPLAIVFANAFNNSIVIIAYLLLMIIIPLICRIPKSKKEKIKYLPNKIYIEEGYIICQTQIQEESKDLEDVKKVVDYGEWYYLAFPLGKISGNFICQKDLLTKGSLEDFEALFKNKIVRKQIKGKNKFKG